MIKTIAKLALPSLALLGLELPAAAQDVGSRVGAFELEDWSQTSARSYDDLFGRAVLLEFFAYW